MVTQTDLNRLLQEEFKRAKGLGFELHKVLPNVEIINSMRSYGVCKFYSDIPEKTYKICISRYFLHAPVEELRTVIMHEVLHLLKSSKGHDELWGMAALRVRKVYNYQAADYHLNPHPYSKERSNCEHTTLGGDGLNQKERHLYSVICPKCNCIISRTKRTKLIQKPHLYWHCDEKFRLKPYEK